ncbi:hypothetical protein L9F63_013058 [Diploptera punctata]|uniref:Protein sleepless n=1 Tax=Diploptera punctata TaxID=6984 RepID=A0AAD8EMX0_DIPPU|nr:hypothetical protein L9F63_013058 [Diploptera punctata]
MWTKLHTNIAIAAALIHTGLCMSCFHCNSKTDSKCADPLDEAWVVYVECDQKDFHKLLDSSTLVFPEVKTAFQAYPALDQSKVTCQKLIINDGEEDVIYRTCSMSDIGGEETCEKHKENLGNGSLVFCQQCDSRLCNTSNFINFNFQLLLGSILFFLTSLMWFK